MSCTMLRDREKRCFAQPAFRSSMKAVVHVFSAVVDHETWTRTRTRTSLGSTPCTATIRGGVFVQMVDLAKIFVHDFHLGKVLFFRRDTSFYATI